MEKDVIKAFNESIDKLCKEGIINNEAKKLISMRFRDKYLRRLSIMDHISECNELYKKYKIDKDEERLKEELMDLFILLEVDKDEDLYKKRINKFIDKIELI